MPVTEAGKRVESAFLNDPQQAVGKTIAKIQAGVDSNYLMLFTDGTWTTTPINGDENEDYWWEDAQTLGLISAEDVALEEAAEEEE